MAMSIQKGRSTQRSQIYP